MRRRELILGVVSLAAAFPALAQTTIPATPPDDDADILSQSRFDDWVGDIRQRAIAEGVTPGTWDLGLQGLTPDPVVVARRAAAAETNQTVTDYVMRLVNGRGRRARDKYLSMPQLQEIELRIGVPAGPLVAFWGMESDYGGNIGDRDVLRATATHGAASSGGPDWAAEFVAGLKILQTKVVPRSRLIGSYAGAVGQTQLMPTNYLKYGVDFDGDGRIDVWASSMDALASTARHLTEAAGWRRGESWLEEAALPAAIDWRKVEPEVTSLGPSDWAAMGVLRASGEPWSAADQASSATLLLPAGLDAPAFLAFPNYSAFEAYNPSMAYAVGVSLLAQMAAGRVPYRHVWPPETALPIESRMAAQAALQRLGYYAGKIDGDMGKHSRKALRDWQLATGRARDGHLTLDQVRALTA
jgi:membrane-bound lytic murein transglycosylase B